MPVTGYLGTCFCNETCKCLNFNCRRIRNYRAQEILRNCVSAVQTSCVKIVDHIFSARNIESIFSCISKCRPTCSVEIPFCLDCLFWHYRMMRADVKIIYKTDFLPKKKSKKHRPSTDEGLIPKVKSFSVC